MDCEKWLFAVRGVDGGAIKTFDAKCWGVYPKGQRSNEKVGREEVFYLLK